LENFFLKSIIAQHGSPERDIIYAIVFLLALGLSASFLCFLWCISRNPIFGNGVVKFPCFQGYESLAANGHGLYTKCQIVESLTGWRLRMGVLQNVTLLGLVSVYTAILVTTRVKFISIVLVVYQVNNFFAFPTLGFYISSQRIPLPSNSLPPLSIQYRLCFGSSSPGLSLSSRCRTSSERGAPWQHYSSHIDSCSQRYPVNHLIQISLTADFSLLIYSVQLILTKTLFRHRTRLAHHFHTSTPSSSLISSSAKDSPRNCSLTIFRRWQMTAIPNSHGINTPRPHTLTPYYGNSSP
jgi:hypothetical protein